MADGSAPLTQDKLSLLKVYQYVADGEAICDLHAIRGVIALMQTAIECDAKQGDLPDGIVEGLQVARQKAEAILRRAGAW